MKTKSFIILIFLAISLLQVKGQRKNDLSEAKLKGKVKSVIFKSYYKGQMTHQCRDVYNDKGNLIETKTYQMRQINKDNRYGKEIYKYDLKGNNTEIIEYEIDGSRGQKENYKYDDKGNIIEKIEENPCQTWYDEGQNSGYMRKNYE